MDTSTSSFSSQNASQFTAQRKFYQWVLKWISGVHAHAESNSEEMRDIRHPTKPDVSTLASFLQAVGFKLLSFEKYDDALIPKKNETNALAPEQGMLRIAIECDASNMRAVLELEGVTCQCPNPDHVKDASFWSISGTGPIGSTDSITHKVEETGSNLLPRLSKDVTRVLRDVSYKLFDTIACEPDVNRNTDANLNVSHTSNIFSEPKATLDTLKKEIGVTRSYTQPEMRFYTNSISSKKLKTNTNSDASANCTASPTHPCKPALLRQKTWDIDIETESLDGEPRPSPPKITSSPATVAELSNSLGQISLQSEIENPKNITEYIVGAQKNLEKALKMLLFKKQDLSPNQDHDVVSVKSAPENISPAVVISTYKPNRSNTTSNVKPFLKPSDLTYEQQSRTKKSLGNAEQTPKARRNIESTLPKSMPRRSLNIEQDRSKPTVRRRSFYIPSSTNSNISSLTKPSNVGQKFFGTGSYNRSKTNLTINSDHLNKDLLATRRSPEPQVGASQNLETLNATISRASMIKPPTKISKAIPVKIKSVQPSKINTGFVKKPRVSLSNE
ncbi:hypothetical protein WH47_07795 [Habropoda laboriosa]|uniref:Uncharacterized protein n=1 Tax=Habropoda laboriosa TaxID=597456 RepID=A0A0L7QNL7_9HYME|nr:hypothetical protein WH47_07795 [Habropoda laboriosa]